VALRPGRLHSLRQLSKRYGGSVGEITQRQEGGAVCEEAERRMARLDVLLSNAGILPEVTD
jgi:NADP-dependent 3-hydroxy acid dehydrogenase YdfG